MNNETQRAKYRADFCAAYEIPYEFSGSFASIGLGDVYEGYLRAEEENAYPINVYQMVI